MYYFDKQKNKNIYLNRLHCNWSSNKNLNRNLYFYILFFIQDYFFVEN